MWAKSLKVTGWKEAVEELDSLAQSSFELREQKHNCRKEGWHVLK